MNKKILSCFVLVVVIFACTSIGHSLDCRKFVFAPVCRGIIAKRGESYNGRLSRSSGWSPSYQSSSAQPSDRFVPSRAAIEDSSHRHQTEIDGEPLSMDYEFLLRNFQDEHQ